MDKLIIKKCIMLLLIMLFLSVSSVASFEQNIPPNNQDPGQIIPPSPPAPIPNNPATPGDSIIPPLPGELNPPIPGTIPPSPPDSIFPPVPGNLPAPPPDPAANNPLVPTDTIVPLSPGHEAPPTPGNEPLPGPFNPPTPGELVPPVPPAPGRNIPGNPGEVPAPPGIANTCGVLFQEKIKNNAGMLVPYSLRLDNNSPNPFNPTTTISFELERDRHVQLSIYSITGKKVITLIDNNLKQGYYHIIWDGTNQVGEKIASGIYLYQLRTDGKSLIKKMSLLK